MKSLQNEVAKAGYADGLQPMSLTKTQESSLSRMSNLVTGNTYLFPAQVFHAKKNELSPTGVSNRAAAYEFDAAGNYIGVKTLSYSALRAAYLGKVTETSEAPEIEVEDRDGVQRAKRGQASFISNIAGGQAPIAIREVNGVKTAAIQSPFALKVTGRAEFYTTSMVRRDDGQYDMEAENGLLKIVTRNDYEFDYVTDIKAMSDQADPKEMEALKDFLL